MEETDISKDIQETYKIEKPKEVTPEIAVKEEKIAKAVSEIPVSKDELEERKKKIINFIKNPKVWVAFFLIIALILGIYIRSMPMHIREDTGKPGLWDITTDIWTLGPDLDPWLFVRNAGEIIETGSIPNPDTMRNVPLGFDTTKETRLLPYMISWTYKISKLFYSEANIEFAGAIFPVIMFALTILAFFLFVREIFIKKNKKSKTKANAIALISTFFMIVIPVFLSRTIAGIPEKESAGFFFMFLAFYFFLKAWKSEKNRSAYICGILAGVSTALMGSISGLYTYILVTIFLSCFITFLLNKIDKRKIIVYFLWWITLFLIILIFPGKINISSLLISLTTFPAFLLLIIFLIHSLLWKTKLFQRLKLRRIKLPPTIITLFITILLLFLTIIIFNPRLIFEKINEINQILFKPVIGRWNTTVAENRQPYFKEWVNNFGPYIKGIAVMFWLFFIGSLVLFKKMLKTIRKKDAWILILLYLFFFSGLVFSRYSSNSILNGENFISKSFYLISIVLLLTGVIYYYIQYYKKEDKGFEKIKFEYLFLFSLFILVLFTARSAVRLIMVLGPISCIFVGYLIVEIFDKIKKSEKENKKIWVILLIVMILLSLFVFVSYYKETKKQAKNNIPSYYNQQWQKAMKWVRENTSENAIFAHWWDYGYWVQSIGRRATVLDGGNAITFWNYYMGRLVLTGDNQKSALEFLYSHDADYLLIDSSDIGKYGAFSIIGSDENYDRYSWIPIMNHDPKQSKETNEGMIRIYQGGSIIDEDIIYTLNGSEIFLPSQRAALIGIIIESNKEGEFLAFKQPEAVFYYNGKQTQIPLRYLEFNGEFFDFENGIKGGVKIIPKINYNQGLQIEAQGSLIYVSPRVMKGFLAQKYLFNDPFNNFQNFEIEHIESNLIINSLENQGGIKIGEFANYNGLQGPIKIWKIRYTGEEEVMQKYLDKDASKYLTWKL